MVLGMSLACLHYVVHTITRSLTAVYSSMSMCDTHILHTVLPSLVSRMEFHWKKCISKLCMFTLVTFLLILGLSVSTVSARAVKMAEAICVKIPCANGGRLRVSNSIWGRCRCMCAPGFLGPYCQYRQWQGKEKLHMQMQMRRRDNNELGHKFHPHKKIKSGRRSQRNKKKTHHQKKNSGFRWPMFYVFGMPAYHSKTW